MAAIEPWDSLLRVLEQYDCQCGSGGPLACDDDCPGDIRNSNVVKALVALITAVRKLEQQP